MWQRLLVKTFSSSPQFPGKLSFPREPWRVSGVFFPALCSVMLMLIAQVWCDEQSPMMETGKQ